LKIDLPPIMQSILRLGPANVRLVQTSSGIGIQPKKFSDSELSTPATDQTPVGSVRAHL